MLRQVKISHWTPYKAFAWFESAVNNWPNPSKAAKAAFGKKASKKEESLLLGIRQILRR